MAQAEPNQGPMPPHLPSGISPEAQQAYLHGGRQAQAWIEANEAKLEAEYRRSQEAARARKQIKVGLEDWVQKRLAENAQRPVVEAAPQAKKWWEKAGEWLREKVDKIADGVKGAWDAWKVRLLKFTKLESGKISVRAETLRGTRRAYRSVVAEEGFEFAGTRYNPSTVAARTSGGLLRGAVSKGSLALAGLTALGTNLWTYGTDPTQGKTFWDRTVKNREFWVSTGVDFAVSVVVGVAAAAVVAGAIALLAGTVVGPVIALPAVAIIASVGVGMWIGGAVDASGFPSMAKTWLNGLFSGQ